MKNMARVSVVVVGGIAAAAALFGLYYNAMSIVTALHGHFSDLVVQQRLTYFYPAFYVMSAVCITFYFLLLVCGIDLLRVRFRWSRFLVAVLFLEVIYFLSIGVFWTIPGIGVSIGAATGVANGGLMAQFIIFPFWAPLVLWWARRRLEQEITAA